MEFKRRIISFWDFRIVKPFVLWLYCFLWFFVLGIGRSFQVYGPIGGSISCLGIVILLLFLYVAFNGHILAMIRSSRRNPLSIDFKPESIELKFGDNVLELNRKQIDEIALWQLPGCTYSLDISIGEESIVDEYWREVIHEHKKSTGYEITLGFPYIGEEKDFDEVISLLGDDNVIRKQAETNIPLGLILPKKRYLFYGTIMNLLVVVVALTH